MPTKPNRTIATYGSFDMFHIGHLRLLQRAKALGSKLIVFVSTDEFNLTKGKQSLFPYEHRAQIILSSKYVDQVYPEQNWEQKYDDIKKYQIDTFVIGDDWKGKFDFLQSECEVVYLARTENISSTDLKKAICLLESISQTIR